MLAEDKGLCNKQGEWVRNIVKFIPFCRNERDRIPLSREVLKSLSRQVVQYMASIGKPPGVYVHVNFEKIVKESVK